MSYGMGSPSGRSGNVIPKGYKQGQLQQFTPQQLQLFQQLFSQVSPGSSLSNLANGDQSTFDQMEAPAMRQFQGLQGQLSSRFSGMGSGARNSSGFQNSATAASSNFAQDLQSQRQSLQRQAIMDLMGISSNLLGQRPYEQFLLEKPKKQHQSSGWGGLLGAGIGGIGGLLAGGGNPLTAFQGAQLGYGVGSGF